MNIQLLKYFLHTARLGNMTMAAQDLHIAQPALSKQIARLEKELDVSLFVRTGRGIRLTDAGKLLLYHSDRMIAEWNKAEEGVKQLGEKGKSNVRLAVYPTFLWYVLPEFLISFAPRNPNIQLEIEHGLNGIVLDWVLEYQMEAGIVTSSVSHPLIQEYPLMTEEFGLLVPAGHPWFGNARAHFSELRGQTLIVSTKNRWYEEFILPMFKKFEVVPDIRMVVHHYDVIKELVRAGLGIAIVPLNAYRWWCAKEKELPKELHILHLEPALSRDMIWIERTDKKRSESFQILFDALHRHLGS